MLKDKLHRLLCDEFFITERANVSFVTNTSGVQTAEERLKTKVAQDAHRQHLKIPRR